MLNGVSSLQLLAQMRGGGTSRARLFWNKVQHRPFSGRLGIRHIKMAYEAVATIEAASGDGFRRDERLILLAGSAAVGLVAGVVMALSLGRVGAWPLAMAVPLLAIALYFSVATFRDALERRAWGCSVAAAMVTISTIAWPISAAFAGVLPMWAGPVAALGSMVLLASCWTGAASAIYRMSGQAAIVGAGAAYLGVVTALT